MLLKFSFPHLSIKDFPQIEIPDFTVITGRNGSGKTHLFNAIQNGCVICTKNGEPVLHNQDQVRLYNWSNMIPSDAGIISSETIRNERRNTLDRFKHFIQSNCANSIRQLATHHGLGGLSDNELLRSSHDELISLCPRSRPEQFVNIRDGNLQHWQKGLHHALGGDFILLKQIAQSLGRNVLTLSDNEILNPSVSNYGSSDIFQQSFARLFVEYRDLLLRNDLLDYKNSKGENLEPALTKENFLEKHGPPPWDFVNASLAQAGLDFAVNKPYEYDYNQFQCTLTKKTTGDVIEFGNLSSGEKIIMSFAFCLYYSTDSRQITNYPKLLLLDEIDAPLHPTMTRSLLRTIQDVLVGQYGISVIASTHSASTVSLSPEDSIYVMTNGKDGLQKSSRAEALNILTEGVPTISLSYSGRRQVFVESNADAETYSELYQIAKKNLKSERSLQFISSGIKDSTGCERNAGCEIVRKLVGAITEAGNTSVFGVLDWDGKHISDGRLFVLAEGSRNGLENVILDPLIVATTICRNFPKEQPNIGIDKGVSYFEFSKWNAIQLQPIVTKVCEMVLGHAPVSTVDAKYTFGMTLNVDQEYFITDDHELERKVLTAFPCLNKLSRGRAAGALMQEIIKTVIADNYFILPIEAHKLFQDILNKEAH